MRNHVLLALCSVLGMRNVEFFTLELLDIVNLSPVIEDIIKSVTEPGKALLYTLYMFLITSVIYASFGMTYFGSSMQVPTEYSDTGDDVDNRRLWEFDESEFEPEEYEAGYHWYKRQLLRARPKSSSDLIEGTEARTSLFRCTLFMFHSGLSEGGNLKAILGIASPGTSNYIARIVYDSIYFVWVGIVLVNIITGLMIDTFSKIREEKADRANKLLTVCFVCGMHRGAYEDLGLEPGSPSFAQHLLYDHDLWTYVFFLAYLKAKDPTEYNGIESYVRGEIDKMSLEWVPSRTSFVLQDQGKGGGDTVDLAAAAIEQAQIATAAVVTLEEKIDNALSKLGPLNNLQQTLGAILASQQENRQGNLIV